MSFQNSEFLSAQKERFKERKLFKSYLVKFLALKYLFIDFLLSFACCAMSEIHVRNIH